MKYFIANWKMKLGYKESLDLAEKIKTLPQKKLQIILAPDFTALSAVKKSSGLDISAQNCAAWEKGSYTGEVSAKIIKEIGCKYAIVGHSERRNLLFETDELINGKIKQAWKSGLTPVFCFGEKEDEIDNREQVIINQIKKGLAKLKPSENNNIFFAYEPVWAIGTGKNCSAEIVVEVYRIVKRIVTNIYSSDFFNKKAKFLYGGSVNSKNIKEYSKKKEIHGFLVGKTSLDINEMKKIF